MKTQYSLLCFQLRITFLLQVFDFELSKKEVEELDSLDKLYAGRRFILSSFKG
jgi:hypothetical protein